MGQISDIHTFIECRCEITYSAFVFRPVNESSGGFTPSIRYPIPTQQARNALVTSLCEYPWSTMTTYSVSLQARLPLENYIQKLPPLLKIPSRIITGGEPVWRPLHSGEPLPPDAFVGGMERGEPTYIARAPHQGSVTPGKYLRSKDAAFLGWSWTEHKKQQFEILCGYNMMWVPGVYGAPPPGALVTGYSQNENRDQLFSVRVRHLGDLVLGKQHDCHGDCYIPYDGRELQIVSDFEILTVPPGPPNALAVI
ncbi:hypothetical protein EVAR_25888_1 [Eumeta japonica]|uniref:Uncharacterized protein n=1 Tax=Eumeta variegata TaxID=151549 RepID=A0A4C1W2B9_EUMVA|nr:hypothetical protein EVAR_25888_1 [Eumeta japonica]